jgi:amidase
MFSVPGEDEVAAVAAGLGIHLDPEHLGIYRERLLEQLAALDAFVAGEVDVDGSRPPLVSPAREAGHRPTPAEDPLNAWMWRCSVPGAGAPDGVLAGTTVSFKDHVAVAGIPMTVGTAALEGFVPDIDATVVTKVLEAGGTVVGKNTMNGFGGGFGFGGGIGDFPRPCNPHAPDHVSGGSSGGSAVAVVAGEVDISFGGDQGGSLRIPAAFCGAVALKPTFGLISHYGVGFGTDESLDHVGPLTRTVEDQAAALQAVAGYDGLDPRQGREVPTSIDVLDRLADGVSGLHIGVLDEGFAGADADVAGLVQAAVDVLSDAGACVSRVSVPEHERVAPVSMALALEGARAVFLTGFCGVFARTHYPESLVAAVNRLWIDEADRLSPRFKLNYVVAEFSRRNFYGRAYARAQNARPYITRKYDEALAGVDVLVMPTCPSTASRYEKPPTDAEALAHNLGPMTGNATQNTLPFNVTGHPALAVPVGKAGGLPASMQLVGRRFEDATLLRAAYAFQHSVDWGEIIRVGTS